MSYFQTSGRYNFRGFGAFGAVTRGNVSTVQQAYDYALASYKDAKAKVCPSAAAAYQQLASDIAAGKLGAMSAQLVGGTDIAWNVAMDAANGMCKAAADYYKKVAPPGATPALPEGTITPDLTEGAVDMEKVAAAAEGGGGLAAGIPGGALGLLALGGLIYLMLQKKGKGGGKAKSSRRGRRRNPCHRRRRRW